MAPNTHSDGMKQTALSCTGKGSVKSSAILEKKLLISLKIDYMQALEPKIVLLGVCLRKIS